jgi:hypothetical protein
VEEAGLAVGVFGAPPVGLRPIITMKGSRSHRRAPGRPPAASARVTVENKGVDALTIAAALREVLATVEAEGGTESEAA